MLGKEHAPSWDARSEAALDRPRRRFFGLLSRRERWGISAVGWLLIFLGALGVALIVLPNLYSFLAVTHRVEAKVLVVEGWVHTYAIRAAVAEFQTGRYDRIFTTGGPVVGKGGYVNDFQTEASVGAEQLKKQGIPDEVLQMVPTRVMGRDRTYSSAVALDEWFRSHGVSVQSINVVTEGAHARRSRLLFEKALGRQMEVGVISVPSPDFDDARWWHYSQGLEDVVQEGLGYFYAKILFHPREKRPAPSNGQESARPND